ncbi:mannitol-1-phosphate 5-dehydrogenase [Patescibacteria group bacterium]|nr:mannitol-1-phosphate 5-dehydrogenase [Patescibacteria group bacterium]
MKKVVQFGAGNIGRGFLGQLFSESGYKVVFVEVKEEIVSLLNQRGCYKLKIVGDNPRDLIIKNVRAVNGKDKDKVAREIKTTNLLSSAVGAKNLSSVASLIAGGIIERAKNNIEKPINLIICENLAKASKVFKDYLFKKIEKKYWSYMDSHLGLVESVISRMVPVIPPQIRKREPTLVMAESYNILPVDKKGFKGEIPRIKGMIPYDNLIAYEEQKLFTHNTAHAICAYLGYQKGYKYIWESIEDKGIRDIVSRALMETGNALIKKHHFKSQEQRDLIDNIIQRFGNRALGDTVARVGKDPIRKLSPGERLIGAANLVYEYGTVPENIAKGIVSALLFNEKEDEEAKKLTILREKKGLNYILRNICQIDPQGKLAQLIKKNLIQGGQQRGQVSTFDIS